MRKEKNKYKHKLNATTTIHIFSGVFTYEKKTVKETIQKEHEQNDKCSLPNFTTPEFLILSHDEEQDVSI